MVKGRTCSNCGAYEALSQECRRKSPTPQMVMNHATGQPVSLAMQPPARPEGWCLEWVREDVELVLQ